MNLSSAGSIKYAENLRELLADRIQQDEMRNNIQDGAVYVVKSDIAKDKLLAIRSYLAQIGLGSLPNYHKIEVGCPNFHRVNYWDTRAHVKGCFHQFVFFPWNQDVFDLFGLFQNIFYLKNLLSGLPKEKFLGMQPEDGCTARLAFQFYPKGVGGLNKHVDPVDHHQLTVPVMLMSQKGQDFQQGGLYVEKPNGERVIFDEIGEPGDVVFFNAQVAHGVERIDPAVESNWPSFEGRWMALFAVNKLFDNAAVPDSVDLEQPTA